MKGRAIVYSAEEMAWLRAHAAAPRRAALEAFRAAFGRDDVSLANLASLYKRQGWLTGRTGRFGKGHRPVNKGMKGVCAPGSEKGFFPKGVRFGRAAALYKPVGFERVGHSGYIERKIHDGLPLQSRWRAVHLIRWEEANGALPSGHCLKCLDGDKANTDPANWALVPRALLPRLNGRVGRQFDTAPAELKPLILAIARLEHGAREKRPKGSCR